MPPRDIEQRRRSEAHTQTQNWAARREGCTDDIDVKCHRDSAWEETTQTGAAFVDF